MEYEVTKSGSHPRIWVLMHGGCSLLVPSFVRVTRQTVLKFLYLQHGHKKGLKDWAEEEGPTEKRRRRDIECKFYKKT